MVNEKMCVGMQKEQLMLRLNPDISEKNFEQEGCVPMDFTGKLMKGFVFVDHAAVTTEKKLNYWLKMALDYHSIAKVAKKKRQ